MLSGTSQRRVVVCGNYNNVSLGVGMPRREQQWEEIRKASFDVGEWRLRRGQQMEDIRMRMLEMKYRMWYSKGLESSRAFSNDTSDSNVQKQLADFASMLRSEDVNLQLLATTQIEKLLSIEQECPTTLTKIGVLQRFVNFLMRDDFLELQYEAAWVLVKIAYGTCADTKAEFVREVVPCFVRLLYSPIDDLCELAVLALGIVAFDSPMDRDPILRNGALLPLLKLLEKHANLGKLAKLSMLRNATWTLSNFFNGLSKGHGKQHVKSFLSTLGCLLHSDDVEVLINSCWAIHGLASISLGKIDALMDAGLCPKLVKHLLHSSRRVQIPVLLTVSRIPTEETHIQALIENGALGHLLTLLTEDAKDEDPKDGDLYIKREACSVTSGILRGNECQIQAVIKAKLFGPVVKLLESPDVDLQEEAAQAISNATASKQNETIKYLVYECKMINPLCNLLSSPNPLTVNLGLQVVENVLDAGSSKQKHGGSDVCPTTPNPYTKLIVEAQCVEKIEKIQEEEWRFNDETVKLAYYILYLLGCS